VNETLKEKGPNTTARFPCGMGPNTSARFPCGMVQSSGEYLLRLGPKVSLKQNRRCWRRRRLRLLLELANAHEYTVLVHYSVPPSHCPPQPRLFQLSRDVLADVLRVADVGLVLLHILLIVLFLYQLFNILILYK
jgi:hypothetical protein